MDIATERRIARQLFKHCHPPLESDPLMLDNCSGCALMGRGEFINDDGDLEPNYAGWALAYVQAGIPIPRGFEKAFNKLVRGQGHIGTRNPAHRDYVNRWRDIADLASVILP